jgi:hypothetical protein
MRESHGDLCSTCRKALACARRITAEKHGFECGEFSGPHHEAQADSELPRGLCSDCENRSHCCLAHAVEGGIWHCEEYR